MLRGMWFVFCFVLFVVVVSVCEGRARSHLLIEENDRRNEFPMHPDMPQDDDYKWKREDNGRGNHNFRRQGNTVRKCFVVLQIC